MLLRPLEHLQRNCQHLYRNGQPLVVDSLSKCLCCRQHARKQAQPTTSLAPHYSHTWSASAAAQLDMTAHLASHRTARPRQHTLRECQPHLRGAVRHITLAEVPLHTGNKTGYHGVQHSKRGHRQRSLLRRTRALTCARPPARPSGMCCGNKGTAAGATMRRHSVRQTRCRAGLWGHCARAHPAAAAIRSEDQLCAAAAVDSCG